MLKTKLLPMIVIMSTLALLVSTSACAQRTPSPASIPTTTPAPSSTSVQAPLPAPIPSPTVAPKPTATPAPTPPPTVTTSPFPTALTLAILEPADESIVEVSNITIRGKTLPDVVLSVNGDPVDVDSNGNFSLPVTLDEGPNIFDVTATDDDGNEATSELVVSYAP